MEPPRRRRAAHAAPHPTLVEWIACCVPLLVGLLLRLWLAHRNSGLTMDSPLYVDMAECLARGQRAVLGPAHHGYPALIAVAQAMVPGRELPGRLVALGAGLTLIVLVYALARRTLSPAWSSLAAALVSLHPLLAVYSGAIMTETTFLAIAYGGLLLIEAGRLAFGGALLGISYWVRPEAMVIAPAAALLGRGRWPGVARVLLAAAVAAAPYLLLLRWEYGEWRITPKDVLVAPSLEEGREHDFAVGAPQAPEPGHSVPLLQRLRTSGPTMASRYLPNLGDHVIQLLIAWPWPLLILSLVGLAARRGALMAPLLYFLFLPLLAVKASGRFPMVYEPALAVYAAAGAAAAVARLPARRRRLGVAAALGTALAGLALCWNGGAGLHALFFDDGPMGPMRDAGRWLGAHGTAGALVTDRKPYVPFYAGMRHVPLPGDDYETVVRWAVRSDVDYLVLEETVVLGMRRNMMGLVTNPEFRAAEHRLHVIYDQRDGLGTGVWIFEVVHEPAAADRAQVPGGSGSGSGHH